MTTQVERQHREIANRIIAGYLEHYSLPGQTQAGDHLRDCILAELELMHTATIEQRTTAQQVAVWPPNISLDADAMKGLAWFAGLGPDTEEDDACDVMLWVGDAEDDEGNKTYGLNVSNMECMEEGCLPLVELPRPTEPEPAAAPNLDELRMALCAIRVVGEIDGHGVVRLDSVVGLVDRRRAMLADEHTG